MQLTRKMQQIIAAKALGKGLAKVGEKFRRAARIGYYRQVKKPLTKIATA